MSAAVGLYENSATVVTYELHEAGPPATATPLWIACYHGFTDVAQVLVDRLPLDERYRAVQGHMCYATAILQGDIFQPDHGGQPRASGQDLSSSSCWCDHGVIVGSDQDWPRCGTQQVSQVSSAMFQRTTEREIQLERRVDSSTPFFIACQNGHLEVAQILFGAGVDIEATNGKGLTPFFVACQRGNVDVVRFLWQKENPHTGTAVDCERGTVIDGEKLTPMAVAVQMRQRDVVEFLRERAALQGYIDCRELLAMPRLSMPGLSWWNRRKPGWTKIPLIADLVAVSQTDLVKRAASVGVSEAMTTDEALSEVEEPQQFLASLIIEKMTDKESGLDFDAAFSSSWSVQMDQALIQFASERALVKHLSSVALLKPEDLFDEVQSSDREAKQDAAPTSTADQAALSRNISTAPGFSPKMRASASTTEPASSTRPSHLSDNSRAAIRARFVLLREWNTLVQPALPLIDLRVHSDEVSDACLLLCQSKGRLMPDTKQRLISALLKQAELSSSRRGGSIPHVSLDIAAPGQEGTVDCVFEQLFAQLYRQHPLDKTEERAGEGQLWQVALRGGGTVAFTDTTDVGGHFRTSIRTMCEDLVQASPARLPSGEASMPLFDHTTNFIRGAGDGEDAAELYVPNPLCASDDYLERYRFVGVMCGASARFTAFMSLDLSSLCWKYLLGEQIDTNDLKSVDVITAELIESVMTIDDEAAWTLRQEKGYEEPIRWLVQLPRKVGAVALRGDGRALVPFAEREEYCNLVKEVWLSQFTSQLDAMAQGFYSVFPQLGARLLTWRELERRVCGLPDVDVSQLQRIARYEGSYEVSHPSFSCCFLHAATMH
jgi:hypothetical protein